MSTSRTLSPLDLEQVIERVLLDVPGRIALEEVEAINDGALHRWSPGWHCR